MTKKEQELNARIGRFNKELAEYIGSIRPRNLKSEYVTCSNCGSKIRKDLFVGVNELNCPACHAPHLSDTAKKRIASYKSRIKDAEKALKAEQARKNVAEAKAAKAKAEANRKAAEKKEASRKKALRKVRRLKGALGVELLAEELNFGEYRDYDCKARYRLTANSPSAMATFRKLLKTGKLTGASYNWDFDKQMIADFKRFGHASCEVIVPRIFEFARYGKTQEVAGETVKLSVMQEYDDYSFDAVFHRANLYKPQIVDSHHYDDSLNYEFGATAAPECSLNQYGDNLLRMGCFE